jgi:hypothetical protein
MMKSKEGCEGGSTRWRLDRKLTVAILHGGVQLFGSADKHNEGSNHKKYAQVVEPALFQSPKPS